MLQIKNKYYVGIHLEDCLRKLKLFKNTSHRNATAIAAGIGVVFWKIQFFSFQPLPPPFGVCVPIHVAQLVFVNSPLKLPIFLLNSISSSLSDSEGASLLHNTLGGDPSLQEAC